MSQVFCNGRGLSSLLSGVPGSGGSVSAPGLQTTPVCLVQDCRKFSKSTQVMCLGVGVTGS